MLFTQMLVMHFMGSSDRFKINGVGISEQFESLMNKNIMYQKVRKSVKCNARAHPKQRMVTGIQAEQQAKNSRNRKNDEEVIVLFEKITIVALMVVVVQKPEKPMHQVLVRQPGYTFHTNKRRQHDHEIDHRFDICRSKF
jgi:hypothetical protein